MKTKAIFRLYMIIGLILFGHYPILNSQENSSVKIIIDEFKPLTKEDKNRIFEESIPNLIKLGLINDIYIEIINLDTSAIKRNQKGWIFRKNIEPGYTVEDDFKSKFDLIIYGEYTYTREGIYILPKIQAQDTIYRLPSEWITLSNDKISLSQYEPLILSYKKAIHYYQKSRLNLNNIAILLVKDPEQNLTKYETRLFRNNAIEITDVVDSTNIANIINWKRIAPHYFSYENYNSIADSVNAEALLLLRFASKNKSDFSASIGLYCKATDQLFDIMSYEYNYRDIDLTNNYLVNDFYNLLKELKVDGKFNPQLLTTGDNSTSSLENMANDSYDADKYFLSNVFYNKALNQITDTFKKQQYHSFIGYNFSKLNQADRSVESYNRSLEYDSNNKEVLWEKGLQQFSLGHYSKAVETFTTIEELDSIYSPGSLNYNIGLCYFNINKYDESIKYFKKSVVLNYEEDESDPYLMIARNYEVNKDYKDAINYFMNQSVPGNRKQDKLIYLAYFNYLAGFEALGVNNYKAADAYLNKTDSIYNKELNRNRILGGLISNYNDTRRFIKIVLEDYEEVYKITKNGIKQLEFKEESIYRTNAYDIISFSLNNNESKYKEVIRYFKLHANKNTKDTLLHNIYTSIGYYYSLLGNIEECGNYTQKALDINPTNLTANLNILELYLVQKKYDSLYEQQEIILNNPIISSQLLSDNSSKALFYFVLSNADIVEGKDTSNNLSKFKECINQENFTSTWDFTIYEIWLDSLEQDKKDMVADVYELIQHKIRTPVTYN